MIQAVFMSKPEARQSVEKGVDTNRFPILYARTKKGQIKWYHIMWQVFKDHAKIYRHHGIGKNGTPQTDVTEVWEGKNIGKKNETSIRQQARNNAESMYSRLQDKGYKTYGEIMETATGKSKWGYDTHIDHGRDKIFADLEKHMGAVNTDAGGNLKPMLAQKFNESRITFPCYVQPKYDGVRCLAIRTSDGVQLLSRNGKPYYLKHVQEELADLLNVDQVLDGEIYCHKKLTFEQITSAIKTQKTVSPLARHLQFVVFDVVNANPFSQRLWAMSKLQEGFSSSSVVFTETLKVNSLKEIQAAHKKNVKAGYEGTMIRLRDGMYESGFRSQSLMKYKDFQDAEFEIVDVVEATGRDAGTAVFVLKIKNFKPTPSIKEAETFNAKPEGDRKLRAKYWKERKKLIGKKATVRFQKYSEANIPIFPTVVAIRDYE